MIFDFIFKVQQFIETQCCVLSINHVYDLISREVLSIETKTKYFKTASL